MIHVLIERQIAEGMISTYEQHLNSALQRSFIMHGFISGEAFRDQEDAHRRFLWTKWRSVQDWSRWHHSQVRRDLMTAMAPILVRDEKITILEQ